MNVRAKVSRGGLALVAALAIVAAGCGGDSGPATPAIPADALVVNGVPNLLLDKSAYTATAVGGAVKIAYVNEDTVRHTLVVIDQSNIQLGPRLEVVERGDVEVGTYQLPPGQYLIVCDVPGHSATMRATLTVT